MKNNIEVFELLKLLCIVHSGWISKDEHEVYLEAQNKLVILQNKL